METHQSDRRRKKNTAPELHFLMADSDLLNNTLPQPIPHLILVDGWIPVLCAQMRRDEVVNLLSQVLIGRLSVTRRREK